MAQPATLFRFRINLSDVDRDVYKDLDLRVAMHPSETPVFLLTRIFAYMLNEQEGLEFSPAGLSDSDLPCLSAPGAHGGIRLWIEVGSPGARKIHKASKAADKLKIYTYKDPMNLVNEIRANKIHNVEEVDVYSLSSKFLEKLATFLVRDNRWNVVHTEGSLTVTIGENVEQGEIVKHSLY